jgi:N-acetyl-anhydromuramyl-L-alanine amidase AmpD
LEPAVAQHGPYSDEDVFESLAHRGWEPDAEQDNYDAERRHFETVDQRLWYSKADRHLAMPTRGAYPGGWPAGAIVHFTAGRCDRGDPDAEATIRYGSSQQHCYFCISRSGKVYQTAPLNRWGSHAGQSSYPGLGSSVSSKLVGIEICNAGKVKKGQRGYEPWWNKPGDPKNSYYTDAEVRRVERKDNILSAGTYHCYAPEQEGSLIELLLWLHAARPDILRLDFVLGHDVPPQEGRSRRLAVDDDAGASRSAESAGRPPSRRGDHIAGGGVARGGAAFFLTKRRARNQPYERRYHRRCGVPRAAARLPFTEDRVLAPQRHYLRAMGP